MRVKTITYTSLKVSNLTLGTMTFGGQTNLQDSLKIMDIAYEAGINLFDTANIYNNGASERIVGKWLNHKRDQVLLASKVGYPMKGELTGIDLSESAILTELDQSLLRLNTDYLDLYYLHAPDYNTPLEETLATMNQLISRGKIRHYAVSNYAAWQLADMLALCRQNGYAQPVMTQNVYNALTRAIEPELVPFLDAHPMALTVYNPFAAGLLTGKHTSNKPLAGTRLADNTIYKKRYWSEANLQSTAKLQTIANDAGLTLIDLAMKFCLSNPKVTSIITGVSKPAQLTQNLQSIRGAPLTEEILNQCQEVWATHTGNPFGYNR